MRKKLTLFLILTLVISYANPTKPTDTFATFTQGTNSFNLNQIPNNNKPFLLSDATDPLLGHRLPKQPKSNREKEIFQWFRTISEVVHLMVQKDYRDVDIPAFIQNALKAAVPTTEPHSSFFSRDSYKAAMESTSGEFSGIGVSIMSKAPEDDSLVIIDVIQGGPSDKAGMEAGDKIVEVDGDALKGLTSDEVITKLRGKTGSTVKIKFIRNKKPLELKIKRDVIKDQSSLCYRFKDQNIYYISLKIFSETAPKQMANLLKKASQQKSRGIILDLRRNPGGVLDPTTIDIAQLFLEKGSLVVSTKDKNRKVVNAYHTRKDPVFQNNIPIFILIDNFTASASEILAGCLRHYSEQNNSKRKLMVLLVGTESFGKGSVQEVIPISNGCALKMTTMLYYLPGDISIQAKGIKPDFLVKPKTIPEDEIKWVRELYGKESSLRNHITAAEVAGLPKETVKPKKTEKEQTKEEVAKNWEERHRKAIGQDTQIQTCINMINMLSIAKQLNPKLVASRKEAIYYLKKHYLTDEEVSLEQVK